MKQHIIIGTAAAILLTGFYFGVVTLSESWSHALDQAAGLWYWLTPVVIGFGVQAGLFSFIRQAIRRRRAAMGSVAVSGGVSAGSMVACCAHHLIDVLPVLGLSGLAFFLADYQSFFLAIGIAANLAGITIMLAAIQRHGLSERIQSWKLNFNLIKKGVLVAAVPVLAALFFLTS